MGIKKGDKIRIKSNLTEELKRLGFMDPNVLDDLIGTEQTALDVYQDKETTYITVDLCREVPIQCCEPVS